MGMQQVDMRIEEQQIAEPEERLQLLAAIAAALREYQRRAQGVDPQAWWPSAKTEWRMLAR